jgi:hypothetical protein
MLKRDFPRSIVMKSMSELYSSHRRWNGKNLVIFPISIMILASLLLSTSVVHGQNPDFTINTTPSVLCVNPGINAVSTISLSSVGSYAGTVNLGASVNPTMSNGPTLSSIPSSETLAAGQIINFNLTISTTASTPLYTYSVALTGFDGSIFHQTAIYLTVAAGCSVGGVVVPTAGLAPMISYLAYGVAIAGVVGIVGATLAVHVSRRKPSPNL